MGRRHARKNRNSVTIQDVAYKAGVSVSTVSRVLNDKDDVAFETYERVLQVIADLGYTSSLAARSMRSHSTNVIGLVMPDIDNPFSIKVMGGVNFAIASSKYDLITYTGGDSTAVTWPRKEKEYVSLLNGGITDGVIVVAPTAYNFPTNAPLVAVDHHAGEAEFPSVISTNRDGALSVMAYLTELGHKRIGFISGRADLQSAIRRQKGYLDGLENAGIDPDPDLIQVGNFSIEGGYQGGLALLNMPHPPTAIFAANDQSALGVIQAAGEMSLKIPEDLSLVGFDNTTEANYFPVGGLTSVDQGLRQMGITATEMLVKLIKGETLETQVHKIQTKLIVRGSCRAI